MAKNCLIFFSQPPQKHDTPEKFPKIIDLSTLACACTGPFSNLTQGRVYVNLFACKKSASRRNEPETKM